VKPKRDPEPDRKREEHDDQPRAKLAEVLD